MSDSWNWLPSYLRYTWHRVLAVIDIPRMHSWLQRLHLLKTINYNLGQILLGINRGLTYYEMYQQIWFATKNWSVFRLKAILLYVILKCFYWRFAAYLYFTWTNSYLSTSCLFPSTVINLNRHNHSWTIEYLKNKLMYLLLNNIIYFISIWRLWQYYCFEAF